MINQKGCQYEQIIVKALKTGFLNGEINEHLKDCAACRETQKIASWLQMSAKVVQPKMPSTAGFIWWKSRIIEKRRIAENAAKPILIAQTAGVVAAFGTFLWLIITNSLHLETLKNVFSQIFSSMKIVALPFTIGIVCFSVVCLMTVLTLRRFLLEK